uniref:BPTI/Kunitz inhibitor domain-containing protein n=1 Tax=Heterorhabditis bacteriophora TaxID=37862 RepID=A0A1I7X4Z5_HETBA
MTPFVALLHLILSQKQTRSNELGGECIEFMFKGCGGNQNRFPTKEDCIQGCKSLSNSQNIMKCAFIKIMD